MNRSFRASSAAPITSGATTETVRLYRRLIDMGKRSSVLWGTSDQIEAMPAQQASPSFFDTEAAFFANSGGRRPAIMSFEYHDPTWTGRYGSAGETLVRDAIIAANARGQIVALHNHPGNPATGQLSRQGQTYPYPGGDYTGTGYAYDMSGSPLAAVLPGGSADAAFLAYLDRVATFLASLVDANGRLIPVIFRWFHECNGQWFWWGAGFTSFRLVFQRAVTYLKDTKGVTNALYCFNGTSETTGLANWYPGDAYVDVLSIDNYDNTTTPTPANSGKLAASWAELAALNATKPMMMAEAGYQYNANNSAIWTQTVATLTAPTYRRCAGVMLWRPPWGPSTGDTAPLKADFSAAMADPRSLTL